MTIRDEMREQLQPQAGESTKHYILRIVQLKEVLGVSWRQFAEIVGEETGRYRDESYYRKIAKQSFANNPDSQEVVSDQASQLQDLIRALAKERVKLSDERTQNNAFLRRMAREETLAEIAQKCADQVSANKSLTINPNRGRVMSDSDREAILLISDWHYGLDFSNSVNTFNPAVCVKRVENLTQHVLQRCRENQIAKITVLNLSDLIAGRIHTQIRVQSREDVISQIMHVSELLAEMLINLSSTMSVDYYDCLDNHSRVEPNKSESLDLESLARFIPFYLRPRLYKYDITVHDNLFSEDIITCNILGHNVVGVHGDRDKPVTALDKITLLTRKSYDLMCTAHLHHFTADEKCGCVTVGNGSLMGADDYALNLRLFSHPSQTLIISTRENACDTIYKINLA